jgi:hypothetical protein
VMTAKHRYDDSILYNEIPILGEAHTDAELGNPYKHFHVDVRFVDQLELHSIGHKPTDIYEPAFLAIGRETEDLDPNYEYIIERKPRECLRPWPKRLLSESSTKESEYVELFASGMRQIQLRYIGKRLNPECMKCPHRGTDLTGAPIINGKLYCPAHGLKFDMDTLECIGVEKVYEPSFIDNPGSWTKEA